MWSSASDAIPPHKKLIVSNHLSPWASNFGFRSVTDSVVEQKCLAMIRATHRKPREDRGSGHKSAAPRNIVPSPPLAECSAFKPPPTLVKRAEHHLHTHAPPRPPTSTRSTLKTQRPARTMGPPQRQAQRPHTARPLASGEADVPLERKRGGENCVPLSPRIVTLDSSPRLKLFGSRAGQVR